MHSDFCFDNASHTKFYLTYDMLQAVLKLNTNFNFVVCYHKDEVSALRHNFILYFSRRKSDSQTWLWNVKTLQKLDI